MKLCPMLPAALLLCASASTFATNFGAIAYDRASGSWGVSYDYPSQSAANARALRDCHGNCSVVVQYYGTCAAYAVGPGTASGFGWHDDERIALRRAVAECNKQGEQCRPIVTVCNTAQHYGYAGRGPAAEPRPSHSCWYRSGHRVPGCRD